MRKWIISSGDYIILVWQSGRECVLLARVSSTRSTSDINHSHCALYIMHLCERTMGLLVGDKPAWLTSSFLRCLGIWVWNGNVLELREKMSIIFMKILLKSMIFVKIILFSEGHQTKPAWDNVHIPQTNVFNVKQFNQNPSPQKPA